jgi:soluble lytic murein transglycosylase-like protein
MKSTDLVRLLPIADCGMFGKRWDYRVICTCQKHAGRRRVRRLASAAARHLKRRGVALLIAVPLAFCALGFPMEAMNVTLPDLADRIAEQTLPARELPIFTTRKVREAFLNAANRAQTFNLEAAKEDFFRTEIPYGSIIYQEALRNNLPPELVAAVVSAESDFRPLLVSGKKAQGLMQIVPETAGILGCGNPFNPAENVAAGARYLRYLLDRFGDQRTALAAYNAGEGNVERFGGVPPFPETLEYLERVSYRTLAYRQQIHNRFVAAVRMRPTFVE